MNISGSRIVLGLCLLLAAAVFARAEDAPADPAAAKTALQQWRAAEIVKLGTAAKDKQIVAFARWCAGEAERIEPGNVAAAELKGALEDKEEPAGIGAADRETLNDKYEKHALEAAGKLAALAKQWKDAGNDDESGAAAAEALQLDWHCKPAHELRGEQFVKGFGWFPAADAQKMAKGQLPFNGEWKPRKDVEKLRMDWANAWEFDSAHYHIVSNIKIERIAALAEILEKYYVKFRNDWRGVFPMREPARYKVYVFSTKELYTKFLKENCPGYIEGVWGQYDHGLAAALFFDVDSAAKEMGGRSSTLRELMLHECTHQLFKELLDCNLGNMDADESPNFWLQEGVCEYYAYLTEAGGKLAFDKKAIRNLARMQMTRQRWAGEAVKLAQFDTMDRKEFWVSNPKRLEIHYLQGGMLCLFLAERHPQKFQAVLRDAYLGDNAPEILKRVVNADLNALQAELDEYVKKY